MNEVQQVLPNLSLHILPISLQKKKYLKIAPESLTFTGVREDCWVKTAIRYVCENGLMDGISGSMFSTEDATIRGQIATILWR